MKDGNAGGERREGKGLDTAVEESGSRLVSQMLQ